MHTRVCKLAGFLAMFVLLSGIDGALAGPQHDSSPEKSRHQQVQGIDFYYGLVPAQIVSQHPPTHEEKKMHGGKPSGKDDYHLIVALFEKNGSRINSADVEAMVTELGLPGVEKTLEPMSISGTTSFGNYFTLHRGGIYRISIKIQRMDNQKTPVEALFEYRLQ